MSKAGVPSRRGDKSSLVGRERELAELRRAIDEVSAGRGGALLFIGEPGIGKTRLADEMTELAEQRGIAVVWGRCWEAGGAPPYWPWSQALGALTRSVPRQRLEALLGSTAADVAQIVPSLRDAFPDLPAHQKVGVEGRFELHAAVLRFVLALSREQPMLIVLDDLHAADISSLSLLELVARELRDSALCLVGTYRDVEARLTPEVSRALGAVSREARVLSLARLDEAATAEFVRVRGGADAVAAEVFRASQGNPLFAQDVLRLLLTQGVSGPVPLPDSVRAVVAARLRALPEAALGALSVAAVLGADFGVSAVAEIGETTTEGAAAAFEQALRAGILIERSDARFAFSHILYREALYRELPYQRRRQIHRRAADRLRRLATSGAELSEVVHHYFEAGEEALGAAATVGAAEWAFDRQAYEDSIVLLERARKMEGFARLAERDRFEVSLALGRSQIGAGLASAGTQSCLAAADVARSLADPVLLARAALGYGLQTTPGLVDARLVQLLEEALAGLPAGHDGLRACLLARLAGALQPAADPEEPMRLAREAVALARSVGDKTTMLTVLHGAGSALAVHADAAERLELGLEHERLALAAGDRTQVLRARRRLVFAHLELGDLAAADRAIALYDKLSHELGQPHEVWPAKLMLAMRATMEGRFSDADALYSAAVDLAERAESPEARATLAMHRLVRLLTQERLEEAAAFVHEVNAAHDAVGGGPFMASVLEALVERRKGRTPERSPVLDFVAWMSSRRPLGSGAMFADAVIPLLERDALLRVYERAIALEKGLSCWGAFSMACEGPAARLLAQAARSLDRTDEELRHLQAAAARADGFGLRPSAARIRYEWARTLLESGTPNARAEARSLLATARKTADELRMPWLLEAIDALASQASEPDTPRSAGPPPHRDDSAPLALIAEGETWAVHFEGSVYHLKDSKSVRTLGRLVSEPGRELHVLELVEPEGARDTGDAGEALDARAIDAYRQRVQELDDAIEEAEALGNTESAELARDDREQIARELASALGLGGRRRRVGSAAERARTAVQRRLKDAILRVGEHSPLLRDHLESSIRTGTFCVYRPGSPRARWRSTR